VTDARIDLSPLDPGRDPDRIERIVEGVLAGIATGEVSEPWIVALSRAWVPALVAAALAGLLALAVPRFTERRAPAGSSADPLAISIGVPPPFAGWAASEELPPTADVLSAIGAHPR
jgi:hypothetical protein